MALDNAECYGTSEGLSWSYKRCISDREQWKRRNAGHYELRNMENGLSVNSDCMVHDKGIGS